MRATLKGIVHNAGLLTFLAVFSASCWAGYSYQLFDVPGSTQTQINAINDSGAFVGIYATSSGYSGFFFSNGVVETLRAPGSYLSFPYGINERGDIVGQQLIDNPAGELVATFRALRKWYLCDLAGIGSRRHYVHDRVRD